MEALSLRNCDVDFSTVPTKIHIRAEISKTNQANDIYISNEATHELKKFIDSKYSKVDELKKYPNHLVFSKEIFKGSTKPISMYRMLHRHFIKLEKIEKDKRRDGQGIQQREINFHLFRTFVKTTISTQINSDFSEFLLSHSGSTYRSVKESERRELYIKCMKYLTFLDYSLFEETGKNIEAQLKQNEKEIEDLRDVAHDRANEINQLQQEMKELKGMYMKAMAGHVVMESDLKDKGMTRRKIKK